MTRAQAHRRWWIWLPLLGIGGWLALFGDKSPADEAISLPAQPAASATSPVTGEKPAKPAADDTLVALVARATLLPKPQAEGEARAARDLFSTHSWNPPPPPAPAPAPPPAPALPPLPYSVIGKKLEDGAWEVYLTRGEQTFVVREGQLLEAAYRIDRIAPPNLQLTYLPLEQARSLSIGDAR